jgi:hypothetical protein
MTFSNIAKRHAGPQAPSPESPLPLAQRSVDKPDPREELRAELRQSLDTELEENLNPQVGKKILMSLY